MLGDEVGAECVDDAHASRTYPARGPSGTLHDAVDLGRLAMGAAHTGFVHEHFDSSTDQFVTSRAR